MHIAFFTDQHPASLGGLQVSLSLQRTHLEQRGHTVSVCAPKSRHRPSPQFAREHDVLVGSLPIGEHAFSAAGARFDAAIDRAFARRAPIDCVHVQGDVWGAWNGYRFAERHHLPLVHTMHTNIEVGLPAILPFPKTVFRMMFAAQERYLRTSKINSIADYTRAFAERADVLVAPSSHFAERLRSYGIEESIVVLPTGVDDALAEAVRARPRTPTATPVLVWPGRISQEKRLGDFLAAFARADVAADVHVYGSGSELAAAQRQAAALGIAARVRFFGAVPHHAVLWAMRDADAVVQSSLGYETQGLTVYEAVTVGTPVILRDRNIGRDLPEHLRFAAPDDSIDAFAATIRRFLGERENAPAVERPSDAFLQSTLTLRAEALYRHAQELHRLRGASNPRGLPYAV